MAFHRNHFHLNAPLTFPYSSGKLLSILFTNRILKCVKAFLERPIRPMGFYSLLFGIKGFKFDALNGQGESKNLQSRVSNLTLCGILIRPIIHNCTTIF